MELLSVLISSTAAFFVLFILAKIMGNRQMSQLSMFDYINGITIGSIAAEMASAPDNYKKPLVAMIAFALLEVLIAYITCKSVVARRFFTGRPIILMEGGKIYEKNLAHAKLDLKEFLTQCRNSGYFDLNNIHIAILETNGKVSFLPAATNRPVTTQDLNLTPEQDMPVADVVIDGHVMKKNLRHTGNNENWLNQQLSALGYGNAKDVFLATCDSNNKLTVYKKLKKRMKRDIFG